MLPQLLSGARGTLTIIGSAGAKTLGFITDMSITITNNVRAVHTFGAPNARSTEPLSTSCSVSFGRVVPVNSPTGQNVDSSMVAMGIEPLISEITTAEDVQVQLNDSVTGASIGNLLNCRFTGRTLSVAAGGVASERVNMIGIYDAASNNSAVVGV
jgi:hypothetical protein